VIGRVGLRLAQGLCTVLAAALLGSLIGGCGIADRAYELNVSFENSPSVSAAAAVTAKRRSIETRSADPGLDPSRPAATAARIGADLTRELGRRIRCSAQTPQGALDYTCRFVGGRDRTELLVALVPVIR
jgi:hypothetical protein